MTSFSDFSLNDSFQKAISALGFETPTPIQAEAIPVLLSGRDVIGRARTGSGKTAAFGLPLLERVHDKGHSVVRGLVLAPTRELALQVTKALQSLASKTSVRIVPVYGGAPYHPQLKALARGASIVVGTPGRVLDHMRRGTLSLENLEVLTLDEADEMLRMGFIEDIETVLAAAPNDRQIALFSATMPRAIADVANRYLKNPITIQVESEALTTTHIKQRWVNTPERFKFEALERLLAMQTKGEAALVFARTRQRVAETAAALERSGFDSDALHGDMNQAARERTLARLRSKHVSVVVATDVAARGIDVEHITHVINYDLPEGPEVYVHRIGRTGRAGREGNATTFVDPRDRGRFRFFQRKLDLSMEQVALPSDAVIVEYHRSRLKDALFEVLEEPRPNTDLIIAKLAAESECDPADIARAALVLLSRERNMNLEVDPDPEPPVWSRPHSRPPQRGPRFEDRTRKGTPSAPREYNDGEWVSLFLPIGKGRRVRPGDLVGAITNEAGITSRDIGKISIYDHKSFVDVRPSAADQVISACQKIRIHGRSIPVTVAQSDRGGGQKANPKTTKGKQRLQKIAAKATKTHEHKAR